MLENLLKMAILWSHALLGNLNDIRNASEILDEVFQNVNVGADHKLFLQLFLIGFCLFCSKMGKRWL